MTIYIVILKPMPDTPKPTAAELQILQVLWQRGPLTVRQIQHVLCEERDTGYTTVLKQVQVMTSKGLLNKDGTVRPQLYSPMVARERTQRLLLRELLDKAFAGSAKQLLVQLLSVRRAGAEEIAEAERLLDRIERGE
jgi:predicted transcriptional regulator